MTSQEKITSELITEIKQRINTEKISQTLNLALLLHMDQANRPNGEPYVHHVLRVANRVAGEYGVQNEDVIVAALLHDSVEDQAKKLAALYNGTEENERTKALTFISDTFGSRAAEIVQALSNEEVPNHLEPDEKNRIYRQHVEQAIKDPDVALVKLADFCDNAFNLDQITDQKRRIKLVKKYSPMVAVYLKRLELDDIPISAAAKEKLLKNLQINKAKMVSCLGGNSN